MQSQQKISKIKAHTSFISFTCKKNCKFVITSAIPAKNVYNRINFNPREGLWYKKYRSINSCKSLRRFHNFINRLQTLLEYMNTLKFPLRAYKGIIHG